DEVSKNTNIILFVDELHTIIGAGSAEGAVDAANIIKPALARGALRIIGATTDEEYRRYIEKDSALERRFQPVTVKEPDEAQCILILKGLRDRYEAHHRLRITDDAIEAAVRLSVRYIKDRFLPDKAIDLIDEAASRKRILLDTENGGIKNIEKKLKDAGAEKKEAILSEDFEAAAKMKEIEEKLTKEYRRKKEEERKEEFFENEQITSADIEKLVSLSSGVPVEKITGGEKAKLEKLVEELSEKIIGQKKAVETVARAVKRGRVGMKDPRRPVASFLFLGPTGVGKTGLTKALAAAVFGSEERVIRLDMSEYAEKHSVSKIIGSPPGYVGYDERSPLLEAVRKNPYSIILFDEAEKAHPDVLNILLQLLDDGRITDSNGKTVDFRNTIIILTSNVGGELVGKQTNLGFFANAENYADVIETERVVMAELRHNFSPEFINRVDEIVIFRRLSADDMGKIAEKFLSEISERLALTGVKIEFSANVKRKLAETGYDKTYGARALRREVLRKIEDTLADEILSGRINKGDEVECTVSETGEAVYTVKSGV
ncbi:MAG: ATP-dependent Clp protease ATP-binding subunit, partial [Ruminococcaceae bacterium]|nr:ATP-dependent Clp protease ATP-binding subunit [Oscillospiraceae bacterium]